MWKKIGITIGLLFLTVFLWNRWRTENVPQETITAGVDTQTLYASRCGICHDGASLEAPGIAALKLLPEETILSALKTGVMKNQAAMLSDKQHRELAAYISTVSGTDGASSVHKGLCAEADIGDDPIAHPQIDNWGIGVNNQRYYDQADLGLNAANVGQLELSWVFAFPNSSRARVQPTIAGNTLFTASQTGTIYALDRTTGCTRWTFQADEEIRSALVIGRDSNGRASRLYFGDFHATVYALDLDRKQLVWKKKIDDHPAATITGSLSLFEDRLYIPVSSLEIASAMDETYSCCSFRGSMVALNKEDGSMVWKTHTISEKPSQHGSNSEDVPILAPSGAPIWTAVTIDANRRCLYVGTGENYTRPATTTSDAILAFSLDEGKILWVQQTIAKDAWNGACVTLTSRANCPEDNGPDADFGAPPILVQREEGDLILAGQKSGHVYALDPDREGKIVWTQLVGRGGMMGGIHWGMATDGRTLFVGINDRGMYSLNEDKPKSPGMHAVNIANGELLWSTIEEDRCPALTVRGCGPGISAAITLTPEVVFGGTLDGYMKAYATDDGRELWAYDTKREYEAVNEVKAFGGAIDSDGPIVVGNQLFITSGYAKFGEKEGNVLLAFDVKK
ncbi:MAG: PQQ-binding-like beta-propeller repeat protein [Bacteroidota bacterium]